MSIPVENESARPNPIRTARRLTSAGLLIGTVLIAACTAERINPAQYNLGLNGSPDLFLVNNPEFQPLAEFISPFTEENSHSDIWELGTSRLKRTNPFSSHYGTLTFLTKEDYDPNLEGQIVRGLLMTDSLKILTIDEIKTLRAETAIGSRFLAPENRNKLAFQIDFEDRDGDIKDDLAVDARLYTHNVDSTYFQTIPGSQRHIGFIPGKLPGSKS